MTTPSASPNLSASRGFRLILPAYKAAFASIATVWPLLVLGGVIVTGAAFIPDTIFDQQPSDVGWTGLAFWSCVLALFVAIGMLIYANIWTSCFTALRTPEAPRSYFGAEERAVFGTVFQLVVRTLVIAIVPLLGLIGVVTLINVVTSIDLMEIDRKSVV